MAQKISDIHRKTAKDEKAKQKVDLQMRQMEDAAMKSYASDISRGGDLTTQALNAAVAAAAAEIEEAAIQTSQIAPGPSALPRRAIDPLLPPVDILEDEERAKIEHMKRRAGALKLNSNGEGSMWIEAKSDEGHTYYWNVKNGGLFELFGLSLTRK